MAGWNGADDFKKKLGGKGESVPCMYKMFGIDGCPHCAKAKALFDEKKDDEGRKVYFKKQIYALIHMIECPDTGKNNKILLSALPSRQVEHVLKKVQETDPDTRWSTPTDLATGRMLVLSKDKGNDEYPVYGIDMIDKVLPLDPAWWEATKVALPRVDDLLSLLRAVKTFDAANCFSPTADMKEGTKAKFRLLPVPFDENAVPFGCLLMHYVPALTPWDKAWADVQFDPQRHAEVLRAIGNQGPGCAEDEAPGIGGMPGMPGAPGRPW